MDKIDIRSKQIKLVPIDKIKPWDKNRNIHPKEQIDEICELIKYQGFRNPLIISNQTGLLIAGHGRLLAAKKMKLKEVPVIYQDFESEDQAYAYMVSDNAIASWANLDLSNIQMDISELSKDFDTRMLGIKNFELGNEIEGQCDPDEVPDVPLKPKSSLGDIYELGKHRLLCGDSTSIDAVEKLMNGEKADMVFTDPPYGISYQSNMRIKSNKFNVIENDETFLSEWINVLPIVSSGWVFIWTTWKVIKKWIEITDPVGEMTNLIVWDKGGGGIGDLSKTFSTDHEIALVFNRGASITGKRLGSVWSIGKDKAIDYKHPTQKPVELGETAIVNCTNVNNAILDLFGGSGSTLIACEKTKRNCFMMELDPHYVDVIVSRYVKFSGNSKIKLNGKDTDWNSEIVKEKVRSGKQPKSKAI